MMKPISLSKIFVLVAALAFSADVFGQAVGDYRTNAAGSWNWNTVANWQRCVAAGTWVGATSVTYPGQNPGAGAVTIQNSTIVTLNISPANSIGSLVIVTGANNSGVTISGGNSLTVTGATNINGSANNNINKYINVAAGSFSSASVSMTNGGADSRDCYISVSTGTITIGGNITMAGPNARNYILFSGSGTLNVGGTISGGGITSLAGGGASSPTSGTVNYNRSGGQNVGAYTYFNLTLSGSGTKTLAGATIIGATFSNIFPGITLSCGVNNLTFNGIVTNSGLLTNGANTVTYGGTGAQSIIASNYNNLTTTGARAANNLTFTGSVGIAGVFSPGATFTSGSNVIAGSTIDFNGDAAQNIPAFTYNNLNVSNINAGSLTARTKTQTGIITVNGNLNVNGYAASVTTLQLGNFNLTVNGNTIINGFGNLADNNGQTNLFIGQVSVNANGAWNVPQPCTFRGGLTVNSPSFISGSTYTFNTNNQVIDGTASFSLAAVATGTASRTLTNANTNGLTITGLLSGAGNFTNGTAANSAILNLSGSPDPLTLTGTTDFSTYPNTVVFNANAAQTISARNFYNLTISGARAATNVTLANGGTIRVSGAFSPVATFSSGNYVSTNNTLIFNGTGAQNIPSLGTASYNNVTVSGGSTKTLVGNVTLGAAGVLNLNNSILELDGFNLIIMNNAAGGIIPGVAYSSANMISTGGTGFLQKNGAAAAGFQITYPVGSGGYYSPMTIPALGTVVPANIHVRAVPIAISPSYIIKYWDVTASSALNNTTVTFQYDAAEANGASTSISYSPNYGTIWQSPPTTGTSSFGTNSFTVTGANPFNGWWTMGYRTYYSYQSGDWNTSNTWTVDPSGTTQVGTTVPGNNDNVVILSGRTVTIPANIAPTGLNITIEEGGFLDLSIWQFSGGLATLSGQGTLKIASSYFPAVTTNTFVNAGGGTTEYRTNINLPSQSVYNNLLIDAGGLIVTQTIDLTLNGDLHIKNGTFRINDNTTRRLKLTVNGNVLVDAGASMTVGTGVTNSTTNPLNITGGVAPFLNYYDQQSHRIVLKGNFTNNGTVRLTNLAYPVFNSFPPVSGATAGFATVYFQGASDNTLLCGGITDFYNLVLDKGIDQTFKLTIYTSGTSYGNFRLFGANIAGGEGGGTNPNLKKALWIRTGTLVLEGMTIIPSLSEGTGAVEIPAANPNSDFYIPANGALVLNGTEVVVLSTADDYREVNLAYNTPGLDNTAMGISSGGTGCALSLYGKLKINNGYLSTRESGGIITSNVSAGQFILINGTVDAKQFLGSTGSASYEQDGGLFILRGRFRRIPTAYSSVANLVDITPSTLNNVRATSGISGAYGSFNLNNANNVFTLAGGTMRIYDVCGDGTSAAQQKAFDVLSSTANCNVRGGTIEIAPATGSVPANDSPNFLITTNTTFGSFTVNRSSSSSIVQLNTNPLVLLNDLTITSGVFTANNLNVTIGGNITIQAGTTYNTGINTTILNGTSTQTFTINLASALSLNNFTIDKPTGVALNFAGSQKTLNINDNFRLNLGTLNDNGNTINVYKNVYNSGNIAGAGKISFSATTVAQTIDGGGSFQNVDLNNSNGAAASSQVSLLANATINGTLTLLQDRLFNISTYNLILGPAASIVNCGANRYIQTSGNAGDGGLTKAYTSTTPFLFPVGAPSTRHVGVPKYTPATIGFTTPPATSYGSITVIPVGYEHPATTINGQSLTYFWRIKSSGFVGIAANSVTHNFVYDQTDVVGTETNYIPSLYDRASYTWNNGTNANPPINTATNNITDWTTPGNSNGFLDADYTAGINAFGTPVKFYSRQSGLWGQTTTWWSPTIGTAALTTPGVNDIVIIRNGHTVSFASPAVPDYLRVANTDPHSCASLQIETGAILDVRYNPGSNFGMVLSYPGGNGTIKVTTNWDYPTTFVFPSGDFSDYNVNMGTTELYTTNTNAGTEFYLPENVSSYGNLVLSPVGGSNVMFPNQNVLIYGNLITRGQNADSWFCPSWGTTYPGSIAAIAKTIHVKGDMDIQGGSLIWYANGALDENFVIDGNVTVSALSALYIYSGATNQRMTIGGSLINNADGIAHAGTPSICDFTNITVTFNGSNPASITNTIGTPSTTFSQVIVNKGNSQATTLTCDIDGTLNTPVDNWLTIQNGTFRYMRTNPNSDFTINTSTAFTIPSTGGLYVDYSNSGNKNILIANNGADASDLYLNGKLTLKNGNVYIGPVAFPNFGNDIEYSGGGASEIEVTGGSLYVNGQIRRNPSLSNGVLKYSQSGGAVTVNGNSLVANPANAKLEILNTGSAFNMSAGTLTIVKGGGATFGDLYLRPESGSVSGGDIVFSHNISGSNQQYLLDATIPLNNITITGRTVATAASATVKLMVNPLVLNGNLTLTNAQSIFDANSVYNLPLNIKGSFTNNGTYNHYNNLTTFSGGIQSLLGSSATDFYDLTVSSVTKLTLSNDITINHDLLLTNGTLECTTFKVNVKGDIINNATYTNTNTTSGVVLNGFTPQHISGTGTFGQLELNNAIGSILDNSITLTKDLYLTNGIFDIKQYLLSLGVNSNIVANGTPFGVTKMITSDGVWSNVGILKVLPSPLSTTFTYPLGTPGKYTPAIFTITSNGSVGSIRINNINSRHPAFIDPANVLNYYWEVEGIGISGFSGTLVLNYKETDVAGGPESSYVAAQLLKPSTNWSKAAIGPGTDNVDETNHNITFTFNNSSSLTGEYTAGNDIAIPATVPQYTSNKDGSWGDNTIWTPSGGNTYPCPVGGPNGFIVTIDHEVTADANFCFAFQTTINNKLKVVNGFFGHNFGTVYGNGTLYLESSVFPAGRYGTYLDCSGNGTIEYGGTGTYNINATLFSSIPRIVISGTGSRILPDKDLTICKELKIDDGGSGALTLDNSINNRRLIINGTFERYNNGIFKSGTGSDAVVEFAGSGAQTIGGAQGDFTGINAFNNFEINNSFGLSVNTNGSIEVNGDLFLTNGLISTTNTNKLTINNYSVSCIYPDGGSASSYIDGPLIKNLNQGDPLFRFPVGKKDIGLGNNLSLRATQTGTLFWIVEYFNPNGYSAYAAPLTAVNTKEYWKVSGVPASSQAYIDLNWNSSSGLTPWMTENGVSDMRVAEHNGTDWSEIASGVISGSDNNTGGVETSSRAVLTTGSSNYTLACVNAPKPTIRLSPVSPICGTSGIPVSITTSLPIVSPFTINYTEDGIPMSISPGSFPASIPTIATGATYILTGFTYNYPAGMSRAGAYDPTPVITSATPTTSAAGTDQSLCGATSATLAANTPVTGIGIWSIVSGTGGTLVTPTSPTSVFSGTNGSSYTLRWTINNGTCTSIDDVTISFPLLPVVPQPFSSGPSSVCPGLNGVIYAVPLDATATYAWSYSGTGATINGTGNSVTLDFSLAATSGTLGVTATNSCGTSSARTINITIDPLPVATFSYTGSPYCSNASDPLPTFIGDGTAGIFSSTAGLVFVSTATGQIDLSASTPGTYTVTNTIAQTGGCLGDIETSPVTIMSSLLWTGAVSADWNDAGNWFCGFVPTAIYDVEIQDVANKPVLSSGSAGAVKNLIIDVGSSLIVTGNSLQIAGNITNNGTFDATDGTLVVNGSVGQSIGAGTCASKKVKNLTISNNSGVTLLDTLKVTGTVLVSNGNLASNGYLVLLSNASGTALIDGSGNGTVTGNVTMQRYLSSDFGYKYFSSPFQAATVNEFGDDMNLLSSSSLFYKYDESRTASGWINYKVTTNVLNPLAGYAVNFGTSGAANTVDITGVVNNGPMSITLYNHNNTYTKGFNLLGNPYPSPIDWTASGWSNTNIDNAIYFFKASTTDQYAGTYISYVNGISTGGTSLNIIPSMQGFFVHVSDGGFPVTGILAMDNSVRVSDLTHPFVSKSAMITAPSVPLIRLNVRYSDDASSIDPMVIYFDENGTPDFDGQIDALKLLNTNLNIPNLSTVCSDGTLLSINALPPITGDLYTVPLGLKLNKNGTQTVIIKLRDIDESLKGNKIFITDVSTGIQQDLLPDNEFSVSLAKGEYNNRFFLNFSNLTTTVPEKVRNDFFSIYSFNGKIRATIFNLQGNSGTLSVYNFSGQELSSEKIYDTGYHEYDPGLKDGIYFVTYTSGAFRSTKKLFIKN